VILLGDEIEAEEEVFERLVGFEEDKKEIFHVRVSQFKDFQQHFESAFASMLLTVSADQKVEDITSTISEAIVSPVF